MTLSAATPNFRDNTPDPPPLKCPPTPGPPPPAAPSGLFLKWDLHHDPVRISKVSVDQADLVVVAVNVLG
ncbi:unnamed protein product [Linum trigynum]